jgi:hypothetical protein
MTGFISTISGAVTIPSWSPTTSLALNTQYVLTQGWSMRGDSYGGVYLIGIQWNQGTTYWTPTVTLGGGGTNVVFTLYYYYQ